MPGKNIVKHFEAGQFYHVYNQGSVGLELFRDEQDYLVFLNYLEAYLVPQNPLHQPFRKTYKDLSDQVQLVAYCLMPDHFHLLLYQSTDDGIAKLMKRVATGYSMYYNRRHYHYGRIFATIYKAAQLTSDEDIMHLSRYLHINPEGWYQNPIEYPYSSYAHFVRHAPAWLHPDHVLNLFPSQADYRRFVTDPEVDAPGSVGALLIDDCKPSSEQPQLAETQGEAPSLGLEF